MLGHRENPFSHAFLEGFEELCVTGALREMQLIEEIRQNLEFWSVNKKMLMVRAEKVPKYENA